MWLTWEAGNVNPAWQHQGWDQRHRGFPGDGQRVRDHPFPGRGSPLHSDVPCWPHEAQSQPRERCRERVLVIVREDLWPSWLSVLMKPILWAWRWGKNRPVFDAAASLTLSSYLRHFYPFSQTHHLPVKIDGSACLWGEYIVKWRKQAESG